MKKTISIILAIIMIMAVPFNASAATAVKKSDIYQFDSIVKKVYNAAINRKDLTHTVYYKNASDQAVADYIFNEVFSAEYSKSGFGGDHLIREGYVSGTSTSNETATINSVKYKKMNLLYYTSCNTTNAQNNKLKSDVATIVKQLNLKSSSLSKQKKILKIYNFLCSSVTYDYAHYPDAGRYRLHGTAYAAICNGTSVCAGYADAFYVLAKEAGLNVKIICAPEHGYNIVEIGGKYYNLDATWDATTKSSPTYSYFLESDADFKKCSDSKNHTRTKVYNTTEFRKKYPMATKSYYRGKNYSPKCSHKNTVALYKREGTCGVKSYGGGKLCKDCGMVIVCKLGSKGSHSYRTETIKAATCKSTGTAVKVCHNCNYKTNKFTTPKTGHSYKNVTVKSTCTKAGYTAQKCKSCNLLKDKKPLPLAKHNYDSGMVIKYPSCAEYGIREYKCCDCSNKKTEQINKIESHSYEASRVIKEPDCQHEGIREYKCKKCGKTKNEPISKTGHSYGSSKRANERAATCTSEGSYDVQSFCEICGVCYCSTHFKVKALGHNYIMISKSPVTCLNDGVAEYKCSRCGECKREIYKKSMGVHNYIKSKTVAPTCTTEGYTEYKCADCNDVLLKETVAPLGHDYMKKTVAPTCSEKGYTVYTCSRCNERYEDDIISPTGKHIWDAGKVVRKPTTVATGKKMYTCTQCNATVYKTIPKLKSNLKQTQITKIKNGGKQFSANWQKASNASGYQIQYAVNKDFKNSKLKTINGNKNKTTIKKQNTHKKYYVRVRQYKIADGKKYYSKWSKPVAVKPIKE